MELVKISQDRYHDFRLKAIFDACKWDLCVNDKNTLSEYAIVLDYEDYQLLKNATNKLSRETIDAELFLKDNKDCIKNLALPSHIIKQLSKFSNYDQSKHIRLMRFDFHPTTNGFKISEVNSDVPAGFAEASALNEIALNYIDNSHDFFAPKNFSDQLVLNIKTHMHAQDYIALIHCTAYSDDRQVVEYIGNALKKEGIMPIYLGPDSIAFEDKKAVSLQKYSQHSLGGMIRVFPIEWLVDLPKKIKWDGFFDTITMCCNHAIAIYAQTKRFPLVFDALKKRGLVFDAWEQFLPKTYDPRAVKKRIDSSMIIIKPALGRVGEDITIDGTMPQKTIAQIKKLAKRYPKDFVAQEKFESVPLAAEDKSLYHACIGAFSINGEFAGLYGRLSPSPRMDRDAIDTPVLVRTRGDNDE